MILTPTLQDFNAAWVECETVVSSWKSLLWTTCQWIGFESSSRQWEASDHGGFLISTHSLTLYTSRLRGLRHIQARDMADHIGEKVTMIGWCITRRTVITTHDELTEFVSFEDTTAIFETNIFPQAFRRYAHLVDLNEPFVLRGRVEDDHGSITLNVIDVDTRLFYRISKCKKVGDLHTAGPSRSRFLSCESCTTLIR